MNKINFEENFGITLFTPSSESASSSKLNEFIAYLKYHKVKSTYKFSFVGKVATLLSEITLNQNILMDFSPNSLTESKEVQFEDFLQSPHRQMLGQLYRTIHLPHERPHRSSPQINKVCSVVKALISEGQFIFMEEPEVDLDPDTLTLFISALKEHLRVHQKNIFIFSENLSLWMPHSQNVVKRAPDHSFVTTPVSWNQLWSEERKLFFTPPPLEKNLYSLKFYQLKKTHKKKAA